MITKKSSNEMRIKRHNRLRKNISGTPERPRLCVYRSNAHVSVQVIDDVNKVTIVSASSMDKDLKLTNGGNVEAAKAVGELAAKKALAKGVKAVVFDRGGYIYHGRIKALAEAARAAGLEF